MPRGGPVRQTESDAYFYDIESYIEDVLANCAAFGIREHPFFGSTWPIPEVRQFATINEAQVYADAVVASDFARAQWPDRTARVTVHARPVAEGADGAELHHDRAYHRDGRIHLPDHGRGPTRSRFMNEWTVLHELAHWYGGNAHADRFRAAFTALLAERMDPMFAQLVRILLAAGLAEIGAHN